MITIDLKKKEGQILLTFEVMSSNNELKPREKKKKMNGGLLELSNQGNALHREGGWGGAGLG